MLMKKAIDNYMDWYYKHPEVMKKIKIINVIIYSLILLGLIEHKEFHFLSIFIWGWGLSVANLFLKDK
jgi:hypothetical protein